MGFYDIFDIYYVALEFENTKTDLISFRLFSAHLGLVIWARLGSFRAQIGSFWIYLGSFRPVSAYLGSFRPVWAHLSSLELIYAHSSAFTPI